jgi:hypothetical protein
MDSCCATNYSLTANVQEWIVELCKVTAKDGVHFIDEGYRNNAKWSNACISQLVTGTKKKQAVLQNLPFFFGEAFPAFGDH